jgi:hypothetical protein
MARKLPPSRPHGRRTEPQWVHPAISCNRTEHRLLPCGGRPPPARATALTIPMLLTLLSLSTIHTTTTTTTTTTQFGLLHLRAHSGALLQSFVRTRIPWQGVPEPPMQMAYNAQCVRTAVFTRTQHEMQSMRDTITVLGQRPSNSLSGDVPSTAVRTLDVLKGSLTIRLM